MKINREHLLNWLLTEKAKYKDQAKLYGCSIKHLNNKVQRDPELKAAKKFNQAIGKSSFIKLDYKQCKTCKVVKLKSYFPTNNSRNVTDGTRPNCLACYNKIKNPRLNDASDLRFYVYSILKNNKCIYIGKGSGNRYKLSLKYHEGDSHKILINGIDHDKAITLERELILQIGKDNLNNIK